MHNAVGDLFSNLHLNTYWPLPLTIWPIPYGAAFWMVMMWVRYGERKVLFAGKQLDGGDDDRGSWNLINGGTRVARVAAVLVAIFTPQWFEGVPRIALYAFGLISMLSGALIRRHCFRILGEYFTFDVVVGERHQIVKHGIYRFVRHPSYAGGLIYNVGIGLALTNKIGRAHV